MQARDDGLAWSGSSSIDNEMIRFRLYFEGAANILECLKKIAEESSWK